MISIKKIVLLALIIAVPFVYTDAQKKKKHKAKSVTTTKKGNTSKNKGAQKSVLAPIANGNNLLKQISADASAPKVVTVTSVFKPSLRNAAKINFTAATPVIDTSKIPLTYNIPSQNLFFSYQPVAIKPVSLSIDTAFHWENHRYIKAGFGNFSTPFLEAALAFGDGKQSIINLKGNYTSSKGNLPFQQFTKAGAEALGIFNSEKNELTSRLYFNNSSQYKYGFTGVNNFSKEQLLQQFNSLGFELGLQNKMVNGFGITYHPQMKVNYFFDNRNASEINFIAKAPINKEIGKLFAFDLNFTADVTTLKTPGISTTNNLYYINPSIQFNTPNFKLSTGIQPSWDNKVFSMLPAVTVEAKIKDEKFILQAGWIGYFNKNSYQSLSLINPYIQQPSQLLNTKVTEQYAGFKGSGGKHFTYNGKISFLKINTQPLFVNDTAALNTQTFEILYEPELTAMRVHGEIGYTVQEKLSFMAAASLTKYTSQQLFNKPYGLLPIELTGSIRYEILKDLQLKSDIFFWDGAPYRTNTLQSQKSSSAIDFNVGAEFSILPKLNLWIQFNNLLNSHYQRWNQYDVLGFNVLGGVVYSFQ